MAEFNEDLADVAMANLPGKTGSHHDNHFSNHKPNQSGNGAFNFSSNIGNGINGSTSPLII